MMLLTKAILKRLPALYSQDNNPDPMVHVKFFGGGAASWYVTEYDGKDTFFGYVDLGPDYPELGYFTLSELQAAKFPPFGLGIERDRYFTPRPLSQVKAQVEQYGHTV